MQFVGKRGGSKKYPRLIKGEIDSSNCEVTARNKHHLSFSEGELQRLGSIPSENLKGEGDGAGIWVVPSCTQGTPHRDNLINTIEQTPC